MTRIENKQIIRCHTSRTGLSLLEVIIATVVLSVSAAMLVKLLGNGDRQARKAEKRIQAQMICQNKLDELLASIEPLESFDPRPSLYYPDWYYSVRVDELDDSGMESRIRYALVVVDVYYQKSDDAFGEPASPNLGDTLPEYSLRRIVRIPQDDSGIGESDIGDSDFRSRIEERSDR